MNGSDRPGTGTARLLWLLPVLVAVGALLRVAALRDWDHTLPSDTGVVVSMAENLQYGLGLVDPARAEAFRVNPMAYCSPGASHRENVQRYYFGDYGLSLIYWVAMHVFANTASPPLLLLWLQVAVDCLNILLMFWIGSRVGGRLLGLAAAGLYAGFVPAVNLAAQHPFYFFWAETFALWNLVFMAHLLADDLPQERAWKRHALAGGYGFFLGVASMVRPTFYLLGVVCAIVFVWRWRTRGRSLAPLAVWFLAGQLLVMSPVMALAYQRFGQLRMPRPMWHMAYIGLGGHPNPYGIRWDDNCGFDLARRKGLSASDPCWEANYERILRDEVLRIRRENPMLWPRNTLLNLHDAVSVRFADAAEALPSWFATLKVPLFDSTLARLLMLACGVLALGWLARRLGSGWLCLLVGVQSLYFTASLSAIIPPYGHYNASFYPGFLLFTAAGFLSLGVLAKDTLRSLAADADATEGQVAWGGWLCGVVLGLASLVCWLLPSSTMQDPLLEVTLVPVATVPLGWLVGRWLDRRAAFLAVAAWLVLALLAFACAAAGRPPWVANHGNACLVVGLGAVALWVQGRLSPVAAAFLITVGTRWHPEAGLCFLLFYLLVPSPAPMVSLKALRQTAAACLGLAAVALPFGFPGATRDAMVAPAACLVLSCLPLPGRPAPTWRRWYLVAGLLALALPVVTFKGLASWRALAICLLLAAASHCWHHCRKSR